MREGGGAGGGGGGGGEATGVGVGGGRNVGRDYGSVERNYDACFLLSLSFSDERDCFGKLTFLPSNNCSGSNSMCNNLLSHFSIENIYNAAEIIALSTYLSILPLGSLYLL